MSADCPSGERTAADRKHGGLRYTNGGEMMKLWSSIRTTLEFLFRRSQAEREIEEELRSHLRSRADELERDGLSRAEAERQARIEFGGYQRYKEECREALGTRLLGELIADVRFGLRQLRRNPGFTAVAIITLALGIGANTAIFSVVDGILLRPLPYKNGGRLLRIYQSLPQRGYFRMMNSPADIEDLRRESTTFEDVAFFRGSDEVLTGAGESEDIAGARVRNDFFRVLGVTPFLGRIFLPEEMHKGKGQVVVLSQSIWQRRFGGDRKILGNAITLNGKPYTVIGVMPAGFHFPPVNPPFKTELWLPWTEPIVGRGNRDVAAIARLKRDATLAQARGELEAIAGRLEHAYPVDKGWRFELVPLLESMVGTVRPAILVLFAATGLVLLIATANTASLLLTRSAGRQREMAIRAAMGAHRARIIRQLLTESTLLALAGGALGLAVAFFGSDLLRAIAPQDTPRLANVATSQPVLLFTLAASVMVGLLFGIAPALEASSISLTPALKEGFTATLGGFRPLRHHRSRSLLVIGQVGLSLVLLTGAGLLIRSFLRLTSVPLGFNPSHVLTFWVSLTGEKYSKPANRLNFYEQTLDRIRALPGVDSAGFTNFLVLSGYATTRLTLPGRPAPPKGQEPEVGYKAISPDYFRVLQIPLVHGRWFTDHDSAGTLPVAAVNQAFAQKYFPRESPLGKRAHLTWGREPAAREIVGVVGDVRDATVEAAARPEVYVPLPQAWIGESAVFVVRTRPGPSSTAAAVRRTMSEMDKDEPVSMLQTMEQLFSDNVSQPRFRTQLLGIFALLALALTIVGVYGVLSYSVTHRTHEIGIRIALGAQKNDVLRMVIREGLRLVLIGVAIGIAGALALTRFLSSLLYGVKPTDPLTFIAVVLIVVGVALLACYIPARRAANVDPMEALRHE